MGRITRRVGARIGVVAAVAVTAVVGIGVVTNAVGNNQPTTFFACATRTGQVKSATIRTGTAPKCNTKQRETVVSWTGAKAIDSIDDLVGTPCRVGDPAEGRLVITYAAGSGAAAVSCPPNDQVTLTVGQTGPGAPYNSILGPGINCGTVCVASFPYGTTVSLSAASTDLAPFLGFSGDCTGDTCTLAMTADRTVTGGFALSPTLPLTVEVEADSSDEPTYVSNLGIPDLAAEVTSDVEGFECGPIDAPAFTSDRASCSTDLASFTVVHLHIDASPRGWVTWSGCDTSDATSCTVMMTSARNVGASVGVNAFRYRSNLGGGDGFPCGGVNIQTTLGVDVNVEGCSDDPQFSDGGARIAFGPTETVSLRATPSAGWSVTWTNCPVVDGYTCTTTADELRLGSTHWPFAVWTAPEGFELG